MYAVVVDLRIQLAQIEAFMPLMKAQAQNSLSREPGCWVFDVCQNPEAPDHILFYEVYDNHDAFEAHLVSDHYKTFDAAVASLVTEKIVSSFERK